MSDINDISPDPAAASDAGDACTTTKPEPAAPDDGAGLSVRAYAVARLNGMRARLGISRSAFGVLAVHSGDAMSRLERGDNVTLGTIEGMERYAAAELAARGTADVAK